MSLRSRCAIRITRTRTLRTRWQRIPARNYATTTADDAAGFDKLRTEMLSRESTSTREYIDANVDRRLIDTLCTFLPRKWCPRPLSHDAMLPMGHHLVWFNASMPVDELLPDGTDPLQSPGEPWVRRMWAGGSVRVRPEAFYQKETGFATDSFVVCAERIQDVRLQGSGDTAKIFVTIDRRFARQDTLRAEWEQFSGKSPKRGDKRVDPMWYFRQQLLSEDWGDEILREQRDLVFLKEKAPAELEAISAGKLATVKYLERPGEPEFSHMITPTRALLFRYSALTFNAHLVHLDRGYARDVEGHRNLLVHGPLSLTLMLQTMTGYVQEKSGGKEVLKSIIYRNLAPLYCDEPMRLCCLQRSSSSDGTIYNVWIEGPTGGVAVKGTIHTTTQLSKVTGSRQVSQVGSDVNIGTAVRYVSQGLAKPSLNLEHRSQSKPEPKKVDFLPASRSRPRIIETAKPAETNHSHAAAPPVPNNILAASTLLLSELSIAKSMVTAEESSRRVYRRERPTTEMSSSGGLSTETETIVRRVGAPSPLQQKTSRARSLARRLARRTSDPFSMKDIPLFRTYLAEKYHRNPSGMASRLSGYQTAGARKVAYTPVRFTGQRRKKRIERARMSGV